MLMLLCRHLRHGYDDREKRGLGIQRRRSDTTFEVLAIFTLFATNAVGASGFLSTARTGGRLIEVLCCSGEVDEATWTESTRATVGIDRVVTVPVLLVVLTANRASRGAILSN